MPGTTENRFSLRADADAPGRARRCVVDSLGDPSRSSDCVLAVSEVVANAVRHSSTDVVEVSISDRGDHLHLEVTNAGDGFDTAAHRGDGLGLVIIDNLARAWGVDCDDVCTVWVDIEAGDQQVAP